MSPLDENHQALLIRLYRLAGDDGRPSEQFRSPGPTPARVGARHVTAAVQLALRASGPGREQEGGTTAAIHATAEGEAGEGRGRRGCAPRVGVDLPVESGPCDWPTRRRTRGLRVGPALALAEALIHTLGGLDEEGAASLTEAERIALADGDADAAALARAELGYVDFLRARYDRSERWLLPGASTRPGFPRRGRRR